MFDFLEYPSRNLKIHVVAWVSYENIFKKLNRFIYIENLYNEITFFLVYILSTWNVNPALIPVHDLVVSPVVYVLI